MSSGDLRGKWPDVPACYGWLSLDRRGAWLLQGERVTHPGLIAFLKAHYAIDQQGCCYVQNGPQRVFVDLACTPWVYRWQAPTLISHVDSPAGRVNALLVDTEGNLYVEAENGFGLLDDRDLPTVLEELRRPDGTPSTDSDLLALLNGETVVLNWQDVPVRALQPTDLEHAFGFVKRPRV